MDYFILDEADRMLDLGFHPDAVKIFEAINSQRNSVNLFATDQSNLNNTIRLFQHRSVQGFDLFSDNALSVLQ